VPTLTLQNSPNGPVAEFLIGVSLQRQELLLSLNLPIPLPVRARGLIDTGSSGTLIDPFVVGQLSLSPTGLMSALTPSTGKDPRYFRCYDASLEILNLDDPTSPLIVHNLQVSEAELKIQGIQALIGRDVLSLCQFLFDGQSNSFSLSY
jgi:hypothetical protein